MQQQERHVASNTAVSPAARHAKRHTWMLALEKTGRFFVLSCFITTAKIHNASPGTLGMSPRSCSSIILTQARRRTRFLRCSLAREARRLPKSISASSFARTATSGCTLVSSRWTSPCSARSMTTYSPSYTAQPKCPIIQPSENSRVASAAPQSRLDDPDVALDQVQLEKKASVHFFKGWNRFPRCLERLQCRLEQFRSPGTSSQSLGTPRPLYSLTSTPDQ